MQFTDLVPAAVRAAWQDAGCYPAHALFDLFLRHAARMPDAPAVITPAAQYSYGELALRARRLAQGLQQAGFAPGMTLAAQLENGVDACALDLAVAALGGVIAPLPPARGWLDLCSLLKRSQAEFFITCDAQLAAPLAQQRSQLRHLQHVRFAGAAADAPPGWGSLQDWLALPPLTDLPPVDPASAVRLLVSSGTEAEPKLVAYSHQALAGGRGRFLQRLSSKPMRALFLPPQGSSFGSLASFGILACHGGTLLLLPRFEVDAVLSLMQKERISHLFGVPTMLQRLAAEPALSAAAQACGLQAAVCGGAQLSPASVARCQAAFGCAIVSLYGSADGVNCHTMPQDPLHKVQHSVGKPYPEICEIRIVDSARQPLAQGEIGEIAARGPISPLQYVQAPELDAAYRDAEGWVYTGDLGLLDADGYLVLAGRKKDIIIRGGVNISPLQIENLMLAHSAVQSAACVALPDADLGQKVGLCLVLQPGAQLDLGQVCEFLRQRGLEKNKWPQVLACLAEFPLTPAAKVDKRALAAHLQQLQHCAQQEAA